MTPLQRKIANVTCWVSTAVIFGAVAVIVAIAFVLQSRYKFLKECRSADCLSEIRYLDALTDDAVDPCVDFYGHVCGRWNSLHGGGGFVQDALSRFFDSLKGAVQRANPAAFDDMAQGFQVGQQLFDYCVTYMNSTTFNLQNDLVFVLSILNVTKLVSANTSRNALILALQVSFETGLHAVVGITRRTGRPLESGSYLHFYKTATLREQFLDGSEAEDVESYVDSVVAQVRYLTNNTGGPTAKYTARDVMDADSRLAAMDSGDPDVRWLEVESLKSDKAFPEGVWSEAYHIFGASGLPEADVVHVLFEDYSRTRDVFNYLDGEPAETTGWYLAMMLLSQALRFDFARRFLPPMTRNANYLCLDAVNRALELHWHLFVRELSFFELSNNPEVAEMFEQARDNAIPKWMDYKTLGDVEDETASLAKRKLNLASFQSYLPPKDVRVRPRGHNLTYLVPGAPWDTPAGKNFPGSYVALRIATQRETMLVRPPDAAEAELARRWADPWPVYAEPQGAVVLPAAYLAKPLMYVGSSAPEANYATVGVALAKALSEAIDPYSRWNVTSSGSFWSPGLSLANNFILFCFVQATGIKLVSERHLRVQTVAYRRSQFAWMRAARVGLDMLRKAFFNGSKIEPRSDAAWTRAQRIFFKRFCLLSCGSDRGIQLSSRERCTWALLGMHEFNEVFECAGNGTVQQYARHCTPL
ncbi:uncharacterized protein LOC144141471 [Haemaphysalis longicornis]